MAGELRLHRLPERLIDDRRVFAPMGLALVNNLAEIDAIAQHQVERPAREWLAADAATRSARPGSGYDPSDFELLLQQPDRAEFGIAVEDRAYEFCLAVDDDELAVLRPIPEWRHPAHPHPLPFRGGDLVADALADDLALKLRKGQQHIEGQAPHRGRCVELLRHRNKRGAPGVEDLDDLGEIGERAGQPVDFVDDDRVDSPRGDIGKEPLQSGPSQRRAGEPAIVISRAQAHPAFVPLAVDEGFASFALRQQRIEFLLEPLLGGFAGVDGTANPCAPPYVAAS